MIPKDESCKNCLFWKNDTKEHPYRPVAGKAIVMGYCKRYPPQLVGVKWQNALSHMDDWCGEWEPDHNE